MLYVQVHLLRLFYNSLFLVAVVLLQLFSPVYLFATPWTALCRASLSSTISWSLLKLISIVSDAIQPSHPQASPVLLPSIFPRIRVFSNESALCIRWPKYQRFSFSISTSRVNSCLISFRIDWFDLLAVQGTLKSSFLILTIGYQFIKWGK